MDVDPSTDRAKRAQAIPLADIRLDALVETDAPKQTSW